MQDVQDLGEVDLGSIVTFFWNTIDSTGASVVRGTNGTLRIYKDVSDVQRTSASGITDTETFDSLTGLNLCSINLADDDDPDFYEAGHVYHVVVAGMILGAVTQNRCLARFRIPTSPIFRQADVAEEQDFALLIQASVRFPMG
jgi:hypothetical protein